MSSEPPVNSLLRSAGRGDRQALDQAWQQLYTQLHHLASAQMSRERKGHLLQTTAVVNEAWFRLVDQQQCDWPDRKSFMAAAAVAMRRVLIDNARKERAAKRGSGAKVYSLESATLAMDQKQYQAIEVNDALTRLAEFAPEQAQALELMIFGGLTGEEVAEVMDISASSVDRRIRAAKAWLARELKDC